MEVIDALKSLGIVTDYVKLAAILDTNKAGISDIKSGRKKLSIELLRRMKLSYPSVNIEWVIMGDGDMFHSDSPSQSTNMEDKLLNTIQSQAEEIGRLKERIHQLERAKNVSDVHTSDIASVG